MRWGVRDESTDDHKTTDLCMKEIERCQRMSVGPSFMVNFTKCIYNLYFNTYICIYTAIYTFPHIYKGIYIYIDI